MAQANLTTYKSFRDEDDEVKININDIMLLSINSSNCKSKVLEIVDNKIKLELIDKPVCTKIGDSCTISNYKNEVIKIVGKGEILDGKESKLF